MAMKHLFETLRRKLRAFAGERSGNVAVIFALAIIPVVGAMGAAVDYSRANSARTALQAAVDSTALMLSKDAAGMTTAQLNQKATAYFQAMFTRPEAQNATVTPIYTSNDGSQLTVNGLATVPTQFVSLMGFSQMTIGATSTVRWGNSRLRVALVLDNTGSMSSSSKMTAMKSAAKSLLTQLQSAATKNGDVYVSIVPFSKNVAVDPSNYNASWVKWDGDDDTWDENNGDCSKDKKKKEYPTKKQCDNVGGTWTPDNHNTWSGCITDRDQDYDTTAAVPATANKATLFPAEEYSSCPTPLMALSYNWTALNQKIDAMSPNGNTNQTIGLQWGFQSLVAGSPLAVPALDPKYKYSQAVILLTDGLNTQNRWSPSGTQVDKRTQKVCDNIKAAGITLYALQVNTGGDPTSSILQSCASSADKFFLVTSSSQISAIFNQIGSALSQLRISK